ncbi:MAG: hypothetical protein ACREIB_11215, partial [Pseudomonadota bacterium]
MITFFDAPDDMAIKARSLRGVAHNVGGDAETGSIKIEADYVLDPALLLHKSDLVITRLLTDDTRGKDLALTQRVSKDAALTLKLRSGNADRAVFESIP